MMCGEICGKQKPPLLWGGYVLSFNLVDPIGFEPITSATSMLRSSQMS